MQCLVSGKVLIIYPCQNTGHCPVGAFLLATINSCFMKQFCICIALCLLAISGNAQNIRLEAKKLPAYTPAPDLNRQFARYSVFDMNPETILPQLAAKAESLKIDFDFPGFRTIETELEAIQLIADDYKSIIQTGEGTTENLEMTEIYTYQGHVSGQPNSQVAITISRDMISGCFKMEDGNAYYFEPLQYFDKTAGFGKVVLYNNSDVLETGEPYQCGAVEAKNYITQETTDTQEKGPQKPCVSKKLRIAIASDYSMVQKYGSAAAVLAHNVNIINLVQTNYDTEFGNPIRLQIVAQYVSACAECDPWPATNNSEVLANAFADWLNAGGFGSAVIDWANLRTTRHFQGANNLAYTFLGGLCGYYRVSVIKELSNVAMCVHQKQTAHELGHSIGALSTSTGIMSELPVCTDAWEPGSISEINSGILQAACITNCYASPPAAPVSCIYEYYPYCFTFNNPCVAGYIVSSNDPGMTVTTVGTTICLYYEYTEFDGESKIFITAVDHCGKESDFSIVWNIGICHFGPTPEERNAVTGQNGSSEITINQTNDVFIVNDATEQPGRKQVRLFDLNGALLLDKQVDGARAEFPLDGLPAGIYAVQVQAGQKKVTAKVAHF